LTIKEKIYLLVRHNKLDKCSQREVALALKIPQPTLKKILKNRKEIFVHEEQHLPLSRKRKRNEQNADVEESLLRWFQQARNLNVLVNNSILFEKSINLALHSHDTARHNTIRHDTIRQTKITFNSHTTYKKRQTRTQLIPIFVSSGRKSFPTYFEILTLKIWQ